MSNREPERSKESPPTTIREALCREDFDWVLAFSVIDLFSASGPGAGISYDPDAVLRKVKELQKRGPA